MKWQRISAPVALLAASLRKKLQNLPMLVRNTIAIFILLVVETVLTSLAAVSIWCFNCCMDLVNSYHSYLLIWYVTQGHLRSTSQDLEKKDIGWILASWKSVAAFCFIFMRSGLCLSFPPKPMAVRVLWALVSLTGLDQPLPSLCRSPLSVQGLAPSPCLSYAVGMPTSSLPSGRTHVVVLSSSLLLALVWWVDLGTSWLPCLRLLMGLIAMTTWLWPMFRPCGTATCWWGHRLCRVTRGSWLISTHGIAVFVLPLDAAPTETGFVPCEKSPMRNSVKPCRVLEVSRGFIINLRSITGLWNAKMFNPGNRNSCIQLNWAVMQLLDTWEVSLWDTQIC